MMGPWLFGRLDLQQQQQQQTIDMIMMKRREPPIMAPLAISDMSYHHPKTPKLKEKTFTNSVFAVTQ